MRRNRALFRTSVLAVAVLLGCDAKVQVSVLFSQLLKGAAVSIQSDLHVQIAGCQDSEDAKKPADSLVKVKETIPKVFALAVYVDCVTKGFETFARFQIPVGLNPKPADADVMMSVQTTAGALISFHVPRSIKESLDAVRRDSFGMNDLKLKVSIVLQNDTAVDKHIRVVGAYVDGVPKIDENVILAKGAAITVLLADVAVDRALNAGAAPVLLAVAVAETRLPKKEPPPGKTGG